MPETLTLAELDKRVKRLEERYPGITVEQMYTFYTDRAIGTKEFRNFLAKHDPIFAEVRDTSVDDEIDENARRIQREREAQASGLSMIGKDGQVVNPE